MYTARLSLDPTNTCWTDAGLKPTHQPASCKFPFKYQGKIYHQCTKQDHDKPWCALNMSQTESKYGHDCKNCSKGENYKWAKCVFGKPCGLSKHDNYFKLKQTILVMFKIAHKYLLFNQRDSTLLFNPNFAYDFLRR